LRDGRGLYITIVTPAPPGSRKGNRVTALRWKRILSSLGHRVAVREEYHRGCPDVLLALHARKSYPSIHRFAQVHPESPLIVALTGTDLYRDIHTSDRAQRSLGLASRLIVLQSLGLGELSPQVRKKTRVITQSVPLRSSVVRRNPSAFEVCVIGHLRDVKDPFRTAMAARNLPVRSRVIVTHVGAALTEAMKRRAEREMARNPRYRWIGETPRWKAMSILARSHVCVLTSRMEGGANVVSEALAAGVPVISTRIAGSIGILGSRYPGYVPVGDTRALREMLLRAESDERFYRRLCAHCRGRMDLIDPVREKRCWASLLQELAPPASPRGRWNRR
jgi:putative glycosyltransferase (TIGR04348 family)